MRSVGRSLDFLLGVVALCVAPSAFACRVDPRFEPLIGEGSLASPSREITTDDLVGLREIDALRVSPDGRRFVIRVRQADHSRNSYSTAWFVGSIDGHGLTCIGDGGAVSLATFPSGRSVGALRGGLVKWAPAGESIAYTLERDGQSQIWLSRIDGRAPRQITHNAADVRTFSWTADGRRLLFSVGTERDELAAADVRGRREGFRLNDFQVFTEIVYNAVPPRPVENDLQIWTVNRDGTRERRANDLEREEYGRLASNGSEGLSATAPAIATTGERAWLQVRSDAAAMPFSDIVTTSTSAASTQRICTADECSSQLMRRVWWLDDGKHLLFWLKEGLNGRDQDGFYTLAVDTNSVTRIAVPLGDSFRDCEFVNGRLICVRETRTVPNHVVSLDIASGRVDILSNVNPEFRSIRMGVTERLEWDLPARAREFGYPARAYGWAIYPPDFDSTRRYPVIIAPYAASGFPRGDVGDEQPLLVYAANGFVVLNSEFPIPLAALSRQGASAAMAIMYAPELGFPHMSTLMESTFIGLEQLSRRHFVDSQRVGIGGLSHGSFVPLFMLQHHDRLAAVSLGGPGWSQSAYYLTTQLGRQLADEQGLGDAWPESNDYWAQIDIADHIGAIEAPLLLNFADQETFIGVPRLVRRLNDAQHPFDAYIYPNEQHLKWQPSHRFAIYNRNVDWFRFWLQDMEDPDPAKAEQYERWRQLRELQCRNKRSLRDYCNVVSTQAPVAR